MKKIHIVITALLTVPLMVMVFYGYTLYSTQAQMPPVNICQNGLEKFTVRRECVASNFNGYKRAIYRCFDGSHGEFTAKSCISYAELKSIANMNCIRLSKCIPTQTPTPTPTPTPTSAYNYPPLIITDSLPPAFYMTKYSAVVTAVDKNYNDALTVKFSYLPAGLTQGPCAIPVTGGVVSCHMSGTPRLSGAFKVLVQVSDGFNPTVSKTFELVVNPGPQPVTEYPTPPVYEVTIMPLEVTPTPY